MATPLTQPSGEDHGPVFVDDARRNAETDRLRRELAARAIRLMGPRSPYWNCTVCGAAHLTPLAFEHKPGCILFGVKPVAIVPGTSRFFHSIQVQNGVMREALEAIANLNHGTTGQAATAALEIINKQELA